MITLREARARLVLAKEYRDALPEGERAEIELKIEKMIQGVLTRYYLENYNHQDWFRVLIQERIDGEEKNLWTI